MDGSALKQTTGAGKFALESDYSIEKPKVELRNYFPETWLFDLIDLDEKGEANLDLETPHTITTWIADAVCSDLQTGNTTLDAQLTFFVYCRLSCTFNIK